MNPEILEKTAAIVLSELRARMDAGLGPLFASDAINFLPLSKVSLAVDSNDGGEVLALLEARGEVYKVDAGWTSTLPQYRTADHAWAPVGALYRGRQLPPLGEVKPCDGRRDLGLHALAPLDAYRSRCLRCGEEVKTPPDVFLGTGVACVTWRRWLGAVRDTTWEHGAALVEALGAQGVSDNVARAEACLRHACASGWVVRGKNAPTPSQAFMDVNGDDRRRGWVTSGYSPGPFMAEIVAYYARWS